MLAPPVVPMHDAGMNITCELKKEDYRAFKRHVLFRIRKIHWFYAVMIAGLLSLVWLGGKPEETLVDKIFLTIGTLVLFGLFGGILALIFWVINRLTRAKFHGPLGEHTFALSHEGITEISSFGTVETKIAAIRRTDETTGHFFIISAAGIGHIIPKRALKTAEALQELRGWAQAAKPAK